MDRLSLIQYKDYGNRSNQQRSIEPKLIDRSLRVEWSKSIALFTCYAGTQVEKMTLATVGSAFDRYEVDSLSLRDATRTETLRERL